MHIAVVAAQGRSGRVFVEAALAAGHTIRAGIRGDSPFPAHERLTIVQCDATIYGDVVELIRHSDAVVSLLGHVRGSQAMVQTSATRTIIKAMQARGLTRLISLTGTGVRIDGDTPNLIDKLANAFIFKIDPKRINDGIAHVKVIRESELDYTIVRVLKLTSGDLRPFELGLHGPAKLLTARADIAAAILECLEDNKFIGQLPILMDPAIPKH